MGNNKTHKKEITYKDVADFFLALANESGDEISNLKLQKLVYYAQAWHLANYGKPLFKEDFEAWVHGPAIPTLYQTYKKYGSGPIKSDLITENVQKRLDPKTVAFLNEVAKVYMTYSAYQLELMTHKEDPWFKARGDIGADESSNAVISKDLMRKYYGQKIKDSTN